MSKTVSEIRVVNLESKSEGPVPVWSVPIRNVSRISGKGMGCFAL